MKRVLLLAYFFPPLGGAGVQRAAKFARYLPEFGWRPTVVTVRHRRYWLTDTSLLDDIPDSVSVRRTISPDGNWFFSLLKGGKRSSAAGMRAGRGTSRARQLASMLLLPDAYRPWKPFALREVRRCLREESFDALMTTSSPDTAHLVGLDVKRESGVPWVADFRDPWTRRIAFDPPTRWHRRWHEAREGEVVSAADRIVVTSNETRDDFVARHESLALADVAVVPNGFDPADFPATEDTPSWDTFDLVYVGQLTARRTIAPLLPIVERFLADHPEARPHTRIRFVGPREVENDEHVRARGLDDVVSFESPRPHAEATRLLRQAHVVLLVEHMGARAGLIAQGKLYECLFAGRPILGAVPHGAVTRLLAETGGGVGVSNDEETPRGAELLASAYAAWRERRVLSGAEPQSITRFERRSLASDLAGELEEAVERSRSDEVGEFPMK